MEQAAAMDETAQERTNPHRRSADSLQEWPEKGRQVESRCALAVWGQVPDVRVTRITQAEAGS